MKSIGFTILRKIIKKEFLKGIFYWYFISNRTLIKGVSKKILIIQKDFYIDIDSTGDHIKIYSQEGGRSK